MCTTWDEIDRSENEEDSQEKNESFSCFMALSDEVTQLKHEKLGVKI